MVSCFEKEEKSNKFHDIQEKYSVSQRLHWTRSKRKVYKSVIDWDIIELLNQIFAFKRKWKVPNLKAKSKAQTH